MIPDNMDFSAYMRHSEPAVKVRPAADFDQELQRQQPHFENAYSSAEETKENTEKAAKKAQNRRPAQLNTSPSKKNGHTN